MPLDENTGGFPDQHGRCSCGAYLYMLPGYEPLHYLHRARSDLDHTCWFGRATEGPPNTTVVAMASWQAFETGNQDRERTFYTSVTTSSSSEEAGKTGRDSGNLPLAPLISSPIRDGSQRLGMSTTDKSHETSIRSAISPGSYRRLNPSDFVGKPDKIRGRIMPTSVAGSSSCGVANSRPFTTMSSSTQADEASKGVWEGPHDLNVLINTLDSIVSFANARVNTFLRPILTRLEPAMIQKLEDSYLCVVKRRLVPGLPPGKAAQGAIRAMVPSNRQTFVRILAAVLIAQDTLLILQEKATRDAIGSAQFAERPATRRGKVKPLGLIGTLERIGEGLEAMCYETMKNVWGSCTPDTMEVLHGTALAAVRAALSS